jgi:hypothetical protein
VIKKKYVIGMIFNLFAAWVLAPFVLSADISRMSKEDLKTMLGRPDLVILDVRSATDWAESPAKIKGALREDPKDVASWTGKYSKEKTFVLY